MNKSYAPKSIGPNTGDVFREYSWATETFHVLGLQEKSFVIPEDIELVDAIRAEVVMEIANEHMGFEGMGVRLNGNQWYAIKFPERSPKDPSPSVWYHHWYPTIPIDLADIKTGLENTFEMKIPAECFDGKIHPNGRVTPEHPLGEWGALPPWCPVYGVTLRVYYDPMRKSHPEGKIIRAGLKNNIGLNVELRVKVKNKEDQVKQIDFIGKYEDINYQGDGLYYQWQYNLFHGKITHHLGTIKNLDSSVVWNTSWIPDQVEGIEITARITDNNGLIYMTEPIVGLKLIRRGLSVELCKPYDVPRSFTSVQYGEWVIPGVRSEKFNIKGDLRKIIEARYVMPSWGDQKGCHGYKINDVKMENNPDSENWIYSLSSTAILPLSALKQGENTFSTIVGDGRMPDIYWPGVQILIRYRTE